MNIEQIIAREIFNASGFPAIECQIILEDGSCIESSVPSGISKGSYEAFERYDGGTRLAGRGVLKAVEAIENVIAPRIIGKEPDVVNMDQEMIALDGTQQKEHLGANSILAVSIAVLKAQAIVFDMQPYELTAKLCEQDTVTMPLPFFNMLSGGKHSDNNVCVQEFLIVPTGAQSFRDSMEQGAQFFYALGALLKKKYNQVSSSIEGAYVTNIRNTQEALDILSQVIHELKAENMFKIALDVAASHLYNTDKKQYTFDGKKYSSDDLIEYYQQLIKNYPIIALEDGLSESDIEGWIVMQEQLGATVQIIGDDIFVTHPERIYQGILANLANGVIIKPNQIGTITETLQAISLSKEYGWTTMIAHRSQETNDDIIADLAVGTSAGQIKAGGFSRGERLAKYNRLLTIEDQLTLSLLQM